MVVMYAEWDDIKTVRDLGNVIDAEMDYVRKREFATYTLKGRKASYDIEYTQVR